jgi:2'-5' RNA ligase
MRLFVATSFPAAITADLNARVEQLKPRLPPASWVRPETQHLTFAFLGGQEESIVEPLSRRIVEALPMARFEARLRGGGFFPNRRRARVGWVGLEPPEPFAAIAAAVREAVRASGIELDRVDFKAHLTLLRIRDSWPPASAEMFEKALADYVSAPFQVDHVTLFSSQLDPKGAVHTAVRTFRLR